jgi:hypothetical protein
MVVKVRSRWVDGNIVFSDLDGNDILKIDADNSIISGPVNPRVAFSAAVNLTAGELIYISGWDATNNRPVMSKADADATDPAKCAEFVCDADVLKDALGYAVGQKLVSGIDTSSANAVGDPVYLSDATAGSWSLTAPATGGDIIQKVGVVTAKHATAGAIMLYPFYSKTVTVTVTDNS